MGSPLIFETPVALLRPLQLLKDLAKHGLAPPTKKATKAELLKLRSAKASKSSSSKRGKARWQVSGQVGNGSPLLAEERRT